MSNARINSFVIDSNTEVMPTISENDDVIAQAINDELNDIENIIVDDDNNKEYANKRQRINDNDINANHLNDSTEVHHESPNENSTSTPESNPTQDGVASSSSSRNTACEIMHEKSCREYYNKNNKNKKFYYACV